MFLRIWFSQKCLISTSSGFHGWMSLNCVMNACHAWFVMAWVEAAIRTGQIAACVECSCRGPSSRGLLTMGIWTPMTIGRRKFLEVESGGGPETQDAKMVRGVHWVEISILSLKMLDISLFCINRISFFWTLRAHHCFRVSQLNVGYFPIHACLIG